ncbi:MAG: bifunctional UDP-N-acetylmuramoyl-tripeptide:D-alanyl-D-alanine ligase/alanine racemase [Bacteroidota bacterium]
MEYTSKEIGRLLGLSEVETSTDHLLTEISIDTRTIIRPARTLFFALPGGMRDGHDFIINAFDQGVRNFVIQQSDCSTKISEANFFVVDDVLGALQKIATHHRKLFLQLRRIGITGSNGKTIIKEWLYQMLHDVFNTVKSPKSYNSQIGMALSLLGIKEEHQLGVFEAGISRKGEMEKHLQMLEPEIGLITNIGSAHDEGFESRQEKLNEKMILFRNAKTLIYRQEDQLIHEFIASNYSDKVLFTWGNSDAADVRVMHSSLERGNRQITIQFKSQVETLNLRYSDQASFENCMHCIAMMCFLGLSLIEIKQRVNRISGLHMRLELTSGLDQSILVNDAYSADLDSLQVALDFVRQQAGQREKIAILSAFEQSGKDEEAVFQEIIKHLAQYGFSQLVYISENRFEVDTNSITVEFYTSKKDFLDNLYGLVIAHKAILIKGARHFGLEDISDRLSAKGHSAALHINLTALEQNLRIYKRFLKENAGVIAVVKASAYGSGSAEVAQLLERNGVDYFAVAFADEGIRLRKAGISTDIMVFNPDLTSLPDIVRYRLEPEVYTFEQLAEIIRYTLHNNTEITIHVKLDTGMHRLGFLVGELNRLTTLLVNAPKVKVATIFSHLSSSEDESDDQYTLRQFDQFQSMYEVICGLINQKPKRHILNSGGISRFKEHQYDYVRLGIGMYGIDKNPAIQPNLRKVHSLYASLIQVKKVKKGESIGYNRKTILQRDSIIGIVNIGYADGVMRNLGNGRFAYTVHGKPANILGNVCMDLTIVDLTDIPEVKVGDPVVIFDDAKTIEELATAAVTIPYEILSRISDRVNRRFLRE